MEAHPELGTGLGGVLGFEYEEAGPDRVVISLEIDERHRQPYGIVHGGTYAALVESAASLGAALHAMEQGIEGAVGMTNTTDFYKSHREGRIRAVATPIHQGRTTQVWQVEVTRDSDGRTLARGQVRLHNLTDPTVIGGTGG
jgi:uncharacterized protein (TIGR00369 family)